jgi:hypothetical protein
VARLKLTARPRVSEISLKFTRTAYFGSPCWNASGRWFWFDADWNTRFPFGTSAGLRIGRQPRRVAGGLGFTLDVNAPLGEPARLYLWGPKRHYMIGLASWHEWQETGTETRTIMARPETVHLGHDVRCRPRIVRGQAWDWKRSEYTDPPRWRWIVVAPNDSSERWEQAHPEEAAALLQARRRQGDQPGAGGSSCRAER